MSLIVTFMVVLVAGINFIIERSSITKNKKVVARQPCWHCSCDNLLLGSCLGGGKLGHSEIQIRPLRFETGQLPES